jgi:hypothetical protein
MLVHRRKIRLRRIGPDEIGAQAFVNRAAVIRPGNTRRRIVERVIAGCRERGFISHQVGHDHTDAGLLVIQHDRRAAICTGAQLQRAVGAAGVERLTIQSGLVIDHHLTVIEKRHMGSRLPSHGFADRAMAGVIVDRIVIGIRMDVVAATSEFMRHVFSPSSIKGVILNFPAHSARLPSMERTIGEKRELARVIFLSAVEADHLGRQKYLPTAADSVRPEGLSFAGLDHDGEVLESYVTKRQDRKAALKFLKKSMKRYGRPKGFC